MERKLSFENNSIHDLFCLVKSNFYDPCLFHSPFCFDSKSNYVSNLSLIETINCKIDSNTKLVFFALNIHDRGINCCYDTGASNNFIRKSVLDDLTRIGVTLNLKRLHLPLEVRVGDGRITKINFKIRLSFEINDLKFNDEFCVLDEGLPFEAIIGMEFILKYNVTFDPSSKTILFDSDICVDETCVKSDLFLYLQDDIEIPPMSVAEVATNANTKFEGKHIVNSAKFLSDRKAICAGRGIITYNPDFLTILLSNLSNKQVSLPKGTIVSYLDPISSPDKISNLNIFFNF